MRSNIITAMLIVLLTGLANAELTVTKELKQAEGLEVGDLAEIRLVIENKYDEPVQIEIEDANMLGGSTLDILCLQSEVPPGQKTIEYDSFELYQPGDFTLKPAKIKYTDPATGEDMTAVSPELVVEIGGQARMNVESVTEVYRCDGRSSTQTRLVSGGAIRSSQPNPEKEPDLSDNQTRLIEAIYDDDLYKKLEDQLVSEGFILQERALNATSEDSGSFAYIFRDNERETYVIGTVEDGNVTEIRRENGASDVIVRGLASIASVIFFALLIYGIYAYTERKHKKKAKKRFEELHDAAKEEPETAKEKETSLDIEKLKSEDVDKVREALRNHIKEELGIAEELTDTKLIRKARDEGHKNADAMSEIFDQIRKIRYAKTGDRKKLASLLERLK